MITPNKHLDLDRSALRVSAEILRELKKRRTMHHDDVVNLVKRRTGDAADIVVGPAINFLYLVGRMEYHVKTDSFEYREPESA